MYRIYTTEEYEKRFNKLDWSIQRQIEKEIEQLERNPYVGKPLGYPFFREKKVQNYRVYYLIYTSGTKYPYNKQCRCIYKGTNYLYN